MTRRCPVIFSPRSTHSRSMRDSIHSPCDDPSGAPDLVRTTARSAARA
jgi:hypothetical protein